MLKAIISDTEFKALSAAEQAHYTKRDDGRYGLVVEGVDGVKLENVDSLARALERERENVKNATREFNEHKAKFGDLDLDLAKRLIEQSKSGKGMDNQAAIDAAIKAVTEKLNGAHDETKKVLKLRDEQLFEVLVNQSAAAAITAEDGMPALLTPHVVRQCKVVTLPNGQYGVQVVDAKGEVRMSMDPENNGPMSVRELVKSMKKQAEYQPAFKGTGSTGSGRTAGSGSGGGSGTKLSANPKDPNFNLSKLMELKKSDPAEFKRLTDEARAAGVTVKF